MPKPTFFNLPEEKREKIIEMAIEEFAKNPFANASLTKIAENAGIAKGSMYQYFEDKKDLYKYMLELCGQKKLEYLQTTIVSLEHQGFVETVRDLYIKAFEFAQDNPKLAAISNFLTKDFALLHEIFGDTSGKSNQFFEGLIERYKAKGEINPDLDSSVMAFVFTALNNAIVDFFLSQTQVENVLDHTDQFMGLIDTMLLILMHGVEKK